MRVIPRKANVRRLIIVVGARPNFVKVGPLMPALKEAGIEADLAHTG